MLDARFSGNHSKLHATDQAADVLPKHIYTLGFQNWEEQSQRETLYHV